MTYSLFLVTSSSYLVTQALSFLTTPPAQERDEVINKVDRLRQRLSEHKRSLAQSMDPIKWGYLTEVIGGNGWIAAGGSRALWMLSNKPFGGEKVCAVAMAFFCISMLSWAARKGVARLFSEKVGQAASGSPPIGDVSQISKVPVQLHQDLVLSRYICPITQCPIRFPVGDPNGRTIYEKEAIEKWIEKEGTSPVTRGPLDKSALIPQPALQILIENRLRFWFFESKFKDQLNPKGGGGSA